MKSSRIILLDGVEATGASTAVKSGVATHSVQVNYTNSGGSVTALVVDLEGSVDNVTFSQLASHTFSAGELTAETAIFHVVNKLAPYVRANITTLTETGTTAVTVLYSGSHE